MTLNEKVILAAEEIIACFRAGGKLLLCGNGGSAADCAHICGELAKGFLKKRTPDENFQQKIGEGWAKDLQMALPVIDLTANSALMCAIINDIDGKSVFAQQVMAYGRNGDILLGISTSGNAENIVRAMKTAHARGMKTIALTGESGGRMKEDADILLNVPEKETYKIQELHLPLYHQLCIMIEEALF